jgi:hypothetical protein
LDTELVDLKIVSQDKVDAHHARLWHGFDERDNRFISDECHRPAPNPTIFAFIYTPDKPPGPGNRILEPPYDDSTLVQEEKAQVRLILTGTYADVRVVI